MLTLLSSLSNKDGDDVSGTAVVCLRPGKKLDHSGIKVELVGKLSVPKDGTPSYTFLTIAKDLEPPGWTSLEGS